jgi:hypothetical protein
MILTIRDPGLVVDGFSYTRVQEFGKLFAMSGWRKK